MSGSAGQEASSQQRHQPCHASVIPPIPAPRLARVCGSFHSLHEKHQASSASAVMRVLLLRSQSWGLGKTVTFQVCILSPLRGPVIPADSLDPWQEMLQPWLPAGCGDKNVQDTERRDRTGESVGSSGK